MRRQDSSPATATSQTVPALIEVGNPRRLDSETIETLIDCEQRGVPSVLWASSAEDLESAAAAVVTHVAVGGRALHGDALTRFGPERALLAESPEAAVQQVLEMALLEDDRGPEDAGWVRRRATALVAGARRVARRVRTAVVDSATRRRDR